MTLAELQSNRRAAPARKPLARRICAHCGEVFQTYALDGRKRPKMYCDVVCSSAANNRRVKDRKRAEREAAEREAACVALANEVLG